LSHSQYKFLDETVFGKSFYVFRARYAVLGGYGNYQIVGYKNLDDLTQKAHRIAYRITKAEALDLPDKVDITRHIALEARSTEIYKRIERESVAELSSGEITTPNVLTKLLRLSQVTGGYLKLDDGERVECVSSAKLNALVDIIDECLDAGKKLVVFARFVPEIEAIARLLNSSKTGYALIKGDVKDRAEQVAKFQTDPNCKVFIGQLQTTGMGLTLTAADTAVFYSLSYNFADYEQAKARIHRIGQQNKCTYIHLVAKNTIDEQVLAALGQKKNMADLVVDNWRSLFKNGGT
jgi:SNF2 family DNA or RNA helicase